MRTRYCPPEVFDFTPKTGPLMGGTNVTINGDNLGEEHDMLSKSEINITIAGSVCKVFEWQSMRVQCTTGPVDKEVSAQIEIYVHDVRYDSERDYDINGTAQSRDEFKYVDPIYYQFNEDKNVRIVYLEDPILKIDGKDLTDDYPIEITINNSIPCKMTDSNSFDAIYCIIEYNENIFVTDGNEYVVDIKVGNFHFTPGRVKFASKPNNTSISTPIVLTIVIMLLFAVITVSVIYYLKKRGFLFKKNPPNIPVNIPENIPMTPGTHLGN